MSSNEKRLEWLRLIEALQGTAGNDLPPEHNHLWDDRDFCALIDQEIFLCDQCGWWCEISEMVDHPHGGQICQDCGGEE